MKHQITNGKMIVMMLAGLLGAVLMGASDWLMIYGDPFFTGELAWLTRGAAEIPAWRNGIAMFLAFPAVILYGLALFSVGNFLEAGSCRRTYLVLTALGMTPWLCVHLFYIMILYLFSWMSGNGGAELAGQAGYAMFAHLGWLVLVGQLMMLIPFVYLFWSLLRGRSHLPRWMMLNNPILLYLVLKTVTAVFPESAFRLGFLNGLMSEGMVIFFAVYLGELIAWQKK